MSTAASPTWPSMSMTLSGSVALTDERLGQVLRMRRHPARVPALRSSFTGFRFPPEVILVAVRWYLLHGLSYRDVEELLAGQGRASRLIT